MLLLGCPLLLLLLFCCTLQLGGRDVVLSKMSLPHGTNRYFFSIREGRLLTRRQPIPLSFVDTLATSDRKHMS